MNQQKRGKVAKGLEVRVKRERSLNLAKSGGVKKKKIASKLTLSQVNFSGFASIPGEHFFFASTYNVVVGGGVLRIPSDGDDPQIYHRRHLP